MLLHSSGNQPSLTRRLEYQLRSFRCKCQNAQYLLGDRVDMVVDVFEQWFDSTDQPKWHQWEDVFDTYLSERGVERQLANRHVPRHPTFDTVYFYNWLRILPDNTVSRLCTTENLYQEFSDIVSRVYQLLEDDVEGDLESSYSALFRRS